MQLIDKDRARMLLTHPDHPVWAILKILAMALGLTFILQRNASSFDLTELKTIVELVVLMGGIEFLRSKQKKHTKE